MKCEVRRGGIMKRWGEEGWHHEEVRRGGIIKR